MTFNDFSPWVTNASVSPVFVYWNKRHAHGIQGGTTAPVQQTGGVNVILERFENRYFLRAERRDGQDA